MKDGFDFETVAQAERAITGMWPRGTDEYERLMARATICERGDVENRCEIYEDARCERMATKTVVEPYTPGRFQIQCCDECAAGLISNGYGVKLGVTPEARALPETHLAALNAE